MDKRTNEEILEQHKDILVKLNADRNSILDVPYEEAQELILDLVATGDKDLPYVLERIMHAEYGDKYALEMVKKTILRIKGLGE